MKLLRVLVVAFLGLVSSSCCFFQEFADALGRAIVRGLQIGGERLNAWSVWALPDVDGDAIGDLVLTAEVPSDPSQVRTWIVSGRTFEPLYELRYPHTARWDVASDTHEACCLAAIPDADGDGLADLAFGWMVTEMNHKNYHRTVTRVRVLSGKSGNTVRDLSGDEAQSFATRSTPDAESTIFDREMGVHVNILAMDGTTGWTSVTSEDASARLWSLVGEKVELPPASVAPIDSDRGVLRPVGDLDGDGVTDWLRTDRLQCVETVVSGRDGRGIASYGQPSEHMGWSIVLGLDLGDMDGDGVPDVALLYSRHRFEADGENAECVGAWLTLYSGADCRVLRTVERQAFVDGPGAHCPTVVIPP